MNEAEFIQGVRDIRVIQGQKTADLFLFLAGPDLALKVDKAQVAHLRNIGKLGRPGYERADKHRIKQMLKGTTNPVEMEELKIKIKELEAIIAKQEAKE